MAHLIDKDALIEYINFRYLEHQTGNQPIGCLDKMNEDKEILSYLNTLEVKEVDLEEEARKWQDKIYLEKGWQDSYGTPHAPFHEIGDAFIEGAKFMIKTLKGE